MSTSKSHVAAARSLASAHVGHLQLFTLAALLVAEQALALGPRARVGAFVAVTVFNLLAAFLAVPPGAAGLPGPAKGPPLARLVGYGAIAVLSSACLGISFAYSDSLPAGLRLGLTITALLLPIIGAQVLRAMRGERAR